MSNLWDLKGKTALVTGGAKRIGRALSEALARAGANVVVHYNASDADAQTLCTTLTETGIRACGIGANLSDPEAAESLLPRAIEAAGPIDILINNASVFPEDTLMTLTSGDLAANVNLHAYAPLALSRKFAAQGREGAILNLLDARMLDHDPRHMSYHLSKRMLMSITSLLALELAPAIRVNGIAPGLILPPAGQDYDYLERLAPSNPLNRYGGPEDIAEAALFLLRSRFVTGQVIYVDGGRHLKGRLYE